MAQKGLLLGTQTGLRLAALYLTLMLLFINFGISRNSVITELFITVVGYIVGVVPALISGLGTGWLIGSILGLLAKPLPTLLAIGLGLLVSGSPVLIVGYLTKISWITDYGFQVLLGIPMLIYVLSGGWMSWQLNQTITPSLITTQANAINPWLLEHIRGHYKQDSRFEIDSHLIKAGFEAEQIERGWQILDTQIVQPPLPFEPASLSWGDHKITLKFWPILLTTQFLACLVPFAVGAYGTIGLSLVAAVWLRKRNPMDSLVLVGLIILAILMLLTNNPSWQSVYYYNGKD